MTLPVVAAPKGRMTEAEAIQAGRSASKLRDLRELRSIRENGQHRTPGQIKLAGLDHLALALSNEEVDAVIALLIERHSTFLASLDVELEEPAR